MYVTVDLVLPGTSSTEKAWRAITSDVRRSLSRAGFHQSDEVVEERVPDEAWLSVARGMAVRRSEFNERFGFLDLASLRARMRPEVFNAFVRHIGVMDSREDLDVNDLSSESTD